MPAGAIGHDSPLAWPRPDTAVGKDSLLSTVPGDLTALYVSQPSSSRNQAGIEELME